MALLTVLVAATVGSTVGAALLYWAGRALGADRLGRIADRLPLVDGSDIDRADGWFARHGAAAVLFGRLIPGVRSFVSVPAGVAGMPLATFVLLTALGSAAYNAVLIGLGYVLGSRWTSVSRYSDLINYGIYAALGLAVAWFVVRRLRRRYPASRRS